MRQLIFLGTGAAMATECYNACFLLRTPDDEYFLTDAGGGNGILRQMKRAEIPFERLRCMFVTHGHSDHIMGTVWVIRRIASLMNKDFYGGEGRSWRSMEKGSGSTKYTMGSRSAFSI